MLGLPFCKRLILRLEAEKGLRCIFQNNMFQSFFSFFKLGLDKVLRNIRNDNEEHNINSQKIDLKRYPINCRFNISGVCNLKCNFCEIHYFNLHSKNICGTIHPNFLTIENLQNMKDLLSSLSTFYFETGVGEPLLNPQICKLIDFFKKNHPQISLGITTNAVNLNHNIISKILECNNFNSISCSIHSGNAKIYRKLLGGNYYTAIKNVQNLIKCRNDLNLKKPTVLVNFCLNTENAESLTELIRTCKEIGVDGILLYHYYQSRNKLHNDISFFFNSSEGNKYIEEAYKCAKELNFNIYPDIPNYILDPKYEVRIDYDAPCNLPHTQIQFPPCLEFKNKHLVGVCNRINLLRINLDLWGKSYNLSDVWNHPAIKYLQETVNQPEKNPICRFCKSTEMARLRCVSPIEYSKLRDQAVRDFFSDLRKKYDRMPNTHGIELLEANPYEYNEDFFAFSH